MVKLRYMHFWPGLKPEDFFITKYFDNYEITNNNDYDILVCSVFPNEYYLANNIPKHAKVILFNGEHQSYIINYINNTGIKPDILIGFTDIPQNILKEIYNDKSLPLILYYPLWILYYDAVFTQEYFDKKNEEVANITFEEFEKKKLCCLINSHDNNNTRTPIYNYIRQLNYEIDCPGRLYNNMDNKLVGTSSEDKLKFLNNYKFNICSENRYGHGYFTEKLPQCMDGKCIPLYIGCNDENKINYKIFNKERVIFINDNNDLNKIKLIINNDKLLYNIYTKPIFVENSYKYFKNYMDMTKKILLRNIPNHSTSNTSITS